MSHYDSLVRATAPPLQRCLMMLSFAAVCIVGTHCPATELEITLESGSVFRTDVKLGAINWKEVRSNGQMTVRRIPTSDIRRLWLCETPASNHIAKIRELLSLLQSADYRDRENAERELSDPETGGQYPKMLRQLADRADAETKYRIGRILNKISAVESSTPSEFDELELKSGRTLRGDAGEFEFTCVADGQQLKLQRNQLRMLRSPIPDGDSVTPNGSQPIQTEIVLVPDGKFYLPEQTTTHLETDAVGNDLDRKADITKTYIPFGLKLGSVEPGYVGISGYGFKFPETPTGDNSGNVFTEFKSGGQVRYKKFRGTLTIDFCLPNRPYLRAGVNEFGTYIATIQYERAFVMEAFNAAGQIVATVEAGERDCAFLGVRTNELIARLQIRRNSQMDKFHRKIDDDFAFDSICFSPPKELTTGGVANEKEPASNEKATARLRNGNVWIGSRLELESDGSISLAIDDSKAPISLASDLIESYTFATDNLKRRPNRRSWSVQLSDGSIINVDPGKRFRSQLVPEFLVPVDQAIALWPSESAARLPHSTDWKDAKNIIVHQTGRLLASEVKFTDEGYRWQTIDKRLQELAPNANELALDEDPMPDLKEVVYKEVDRNSAPTLWLQRPQTLNPDAGYVLLRDGQRLMFGQKCLFQLVDRDGDSIKLKLNARTIEIDNARVQSVKLEARP